MALDTLPQGWCLTTLENVADWGSGGTPSRKESAYYNGNVPWIKTGDLGPKILYASSEYISELGVKNSSAKYFPKGSVAIAMYGATIGKTSILGIDATTNQACGVGNPILGLTFSEFLYYFLLNEKDSFIAKGKGGAQPNISQALIKEHEIYLPPLAEQKVIADKLDTLLAQVETTKARLERIPEILKRFRQSVLTAAVSGKLTKDFFCDSELEDDITEDWIAYQKKIFETIGKQPKSKNWMKSAPKPENRCEFADRLPAGKGWRIFFLDDIIFSKNQGVNTTTEKVEYTSSGIVAIQAGNIQEGYVHFQTDKFVSTEKFESLSAHVKPKPNDVLYTNIGANFGNAAVVPSEIDSFLITWNVMRIVPSRLIMPKYLEMVLNSKIIRDEALKAVSTSTVPFVNGKTIGQYVIPTPQIPEQVEIVRRVEELFAFADSIEQKATAALARVNNLTQSILAKAFRGELTADWRAANPELISGDNSAAALLEKIKAERAALAGKKTRKKA